MPPTEASLTRTLKELSAETDATNRAHLETVLGSLHYGLLLRFGDLIESNTSLSPQLRRNLEMRSELARVPAAELWDRLMALGQRDPEPDDALARAIITLNDPYVSDGREVLALRLLGRMKHRQAVGVIVDKLVSRAEADELTTACVDALVATGSVETVTKVKDRFATLSPALRLCASDIFRRIKLAQSESAVVAQLGREPDARVRAGLALALCELAATEPAALDQLGKIAGSADAALDQDISAVFTIAGRPMPKPATSTAAAFASKPTAAPFEWDDDVDEELLPREAEADVAAAEPPEPPAPATIRRDAPKVGRNDPCPCGSGKKYKKCCGR
jgi:hypothetical protein